MTRGVCLIAYGAKATQQADQCITSLRKYHDWPACVAGMTKQIEQQANYTDIQRSRWAKVTLDQWSPFDDTLYLDADTRVQGDLSKGFEMLADGWDMLITASPQQGKENMWHIGQRERETTLEMYQCGAVLQLQGGVFWFRKSEAVRRFFAAWRAAWKCFEQFDQAALLRALRDAPVKLHLLGRPYNGGAVVVHRHGQAVR